MDAVCVECGSPLPLGGECWTRVHELLEIESHVLVDVNVEIGLRAHYYAIASYQLQHPSRSNLPVLLGLFGDVAAMLDEPRPMSELRRDVRRRLRDGQVSRIAEPGDRAHIPGQWPTQWTITAADVIARPEDQYVALVRGWAEATVTQLSALGSREHL